MINPYDKYRSSAIQTADNGKLLLMVYDFCIQSCERAIEAENAGNIEARAKAIGKAQDGLTELTCALDFENGGDVAKNLWRLYDFMSWYLGEANLKRRADYVAKVRDLLMELRSSWGEAIENLRRENHRALAGGPRPTALVG